MGTPDPKLEWRRYRRTRSRIVGDRLGERRAELGWSQVTLAEKVTDRGLRMTQATVSRAESGAGVDEVELIFFHLVLRCTITYLLGLTDDPKKWTPDPKKLKDVATRVSLAGRSSHSPGLTVLPGSRGDEISAVQSPTVSVVRPPLVPAT